MSQPERARASASRTTGTSAAGASAPSTVEYAIIAVLIAAVAVGTWKTFGEVRDPDGMEEAVGRP